VQFKAGNSNFASFAANDGLVSAVPEPTTYAMLLIGLGLLGFTARRKQEAKFKSPRPPRLAAQEKARRSARTRRALHGGHDAFVAVAFAVVVRAALG
jgi:hypothetical protein